MEQPIVGSLSRLCLSCHDGTVAIDSFGGNPGKDENRLTGKTSKGIDLSDDHPVSFKWTHKIQWIPGASIDMNNCYKCHNSDDFFGKEEPGKELKFYSGRMECPTCHDVHNNQVEDEKLLRKTREGSALCLHCHIK